MMRQVNFSRFAGVQVVTDEGLTAWKGWNWSALYQSKSRLFKVKLCWRPLLRNEQMTKNTLHRGLSVSVYQNEFHIFHHQTEMVVRRDKDDALLRLKYYSCIRGKLEEINTPKNSLKAIPTDKASLCSTTLYQAHQTSIAFTIYNYRMTWSHYVMVHY